MIILVGLPGSGKSSAGRQVARRFALPFVDSDHEIEADLGMSIREYFAAHGEQAFRDQESAMLARIAAAGGRCVLSTGGGAVLRKENRELLHASGTVLYLRASPDEIFRRLRHDTKRPLLQVANPKARIQDLFRERDPLYREVAHYTIEAGRSSVQSLVHAIAMQLELAGVRDLPSLQPPPAE